MSDVLPTPPTSPTALATLQVSSFASLKAIDALLERYLYLLDEQQRLQHELGKHLSKLALAKRISHPQAFFSLARANHSCRPGRRYGEECYDERMTAVRKVALCPSDLTSPNTDLPTDTCLSHIPQRFTIIKHIASDDNTVIALEPSPSDRSPANAVAEDQPQVADSPSISKTRPPSIDPLQWFGILTPASLRDAQSSFSSAVDGPIARLLNVVAEMRDVEQTITGLRKLVAAESVPLQDAKCP
ncbi:hypothetical protein LOZ12_002206 [Ophidiomyces ophidiicola]|uniref:uncharacterized protein n=1 Tax=Ophidiomyces ophidiicola TaxID=1387563 RepID=UPI0020C57E56|nr:uncharacterized protein LOZ57_001891 [Ophidiomyces ophidiicola]KAI1910752.1 hypothetical protein LOZ61_004214 [Ophidiomyces ophidiicola]KAI1929007.1 hypothetical protein LOZ60_001922 [Ophidiomyces ophidiicola]KAI1950332.1 hypothetical protein LOZ57_001891 [Ophidiomyces ophidiicola]KAI2001958.1 hypothetical protein LOZ50_005305 [Ophidiomyces ophidiicola]KAI2013294.1 hypothetical protein LOZ49_002184 [Ophidiomyces ophidiicola]